MVLDLTIRHLGSVEAFISFDFLLICHLLVLLALLFFLATKLGGFYNTRQKRMVGLLLDPIIRR